MSDIKVTPEQLEAAIQEFMEHFKEVRANKGMLAFASEYELRGKLDEEVEEFTEAIHKRMSIEDKAGELKDVATTAIWGLASYRVGMKQKLKKHEPDLEESIEAEIKLRAGERDFSRGLYRHYRLIGYSPQQITYQMCHEEIS